MEKSTTSLVLLALFISLLEFPGRDVASPLVEIVAKPLIIEVAAGGVSELDFRVLAEGTGLEFQWQLDGPGELEVRSPRSYALYRPPDTIDRATTVLVTVKVTDEFGQYTFAGYPFDLVPAKKRVIVPTVMGAGAVIGLGTGIYFLSNDNDNDSNKDKPTLEITSPLENSQVERIENVIGFAKNFVPGDQVVIIVIPHDDQEYEQPNRGRVDEIGNWLAEGVVFGRAGDLDSGRSFDIRAELRDELDQTIKATDSITVIRR